MASDFVTTMATAVFHIAQPRRARDPLVHAS